MSDLVDLLDLNTRASAQQKAKFRSVTPRPDPKTSPKATSDTHSKGQPVHPRHWGDALQSLGV